MNPNARTESIRTTLELLIRVSTGTHSLANAIRLLQASDVRDSTLRSGMAGSEGGHAIGGHSDPTGDTACRGMSTQHQLTIDGIDLRLARILADATWIDLEVGKAMRAPKDPRPKQKPLEGCTSCHRDHGAWEPIDHRRPSGGLCRWCADFLNDYGRRPTVRLVELHRQGRRITTQMIATELGPNQPEGLTVTVET